MKIDEKIQRISERSQSKKDKIGIILGISLLIACGLSYFVLDAFGQQEFLIDCPENAYHGIDNQGNAACRDILTNQILEPEIRAITDSDFEENTSDASQSTSEIGEVFSSEQIPIVETIILFLIGIGGSIVLIGIKNKKFELFQRHGWNSTQKEQVRSRQYGKCNMCFTQPSQWKYDHIDGDKNNNELNNCQGLCPDCISVKIERDNRIIYRK